MDNDVDETFEIPLLQL